MTDTIVPTLLNRKNYDDWSSRIQSYLLAEELWDIVKGTDDHIDEALRKKDVKALYAIKSSCGNETYTLIKNKATAKEAWDTLLDILKPTYNLSSRKKDTRTIGQAMEEWRTGGIYRPELAMEEGRTGGDDESDAKNIPATFVKYVESKKWDEAIKFLRQHRQVGSARIFDGTALHFAVKSLSNCSVRNIEELVDLMEKEDLEIQDTDGYTALYSLVGQCPEMVEVAKRMVAKKDSLLTILPAGKDHLIVRAERQEKGERMARYLYSLTPRETLRVSDVSQLISLGFHLKRFDIAWDLIQHYPKLVVAKDNDGDIPLISLAGNPLAFRSGVRLNLWENLIYCGMHIKSVPSNPESDQSNQRPLSNQKENQMHLISSVMGLFGGLVTNLLKLLGINHIYEMKLMHKRADEFLLLMRKATKDIGEIELFKEALCVATGRGHAEYLMYFYTNELIDELFSEKGQNLLQISTDCRQHRVYNYIYVLLHEQDKDRSNQLRDKVGTTDSFGNNMLHKAANIPPMSKIEHIRGPALQMQRELQWFKEMESFVYPKHRESLNYDNMTPREVFTKNHKKMVKEAEKSMKETATSCTVVGALIVTMMFAAAFTVPGGNDKGTNLHTSLTKRVFTTFIVADAISLFSSTTSVIMFLGILTSRYSEDDFLKSLPTKMITGLCTLFLSLTTMMIVFSCALYIMLEGKSSIIIPSILLATVPVTSFIWTQFPLLTELFISTFGRGMFDRNERKIIFETLKKIEMF